MDHLNLESFTQPQMTLQLHHPPMQGISLPFLVSATYLHIRLLSGHQLVGPGTGSTLHARTQVHKAEFSTAYQQGYKLEKEKENCLKRGPRHG
eukprot:2596066-Rhodomonas_salina.7